MNGYTVTPTVDDRGNYTGSEVHSSTMREHVVGRNGQVIGNDEMFYEDATGNIHHHFENVELVDESTPESFDSEDYFGAVLESMPLLEDAVQWAIQNQEMMPEGFIEEWNSLIESGDDLGRFHELAERLLEFAPDDLNVEPTSEVEQWFEETPQEVVDSAVERILDWNIQVDDAESMVEMATHYDNDSTEHAILRMGVDVAFSKTTQQDAINQIVGRFGAAEAFRAWKQLEHFASEQLQNNTY